MSSGYKDEVFKDMEDTIKGMKFRPGSMYHEDKPLRMYLFRPKGEEVNSFLQLGTSLEEAYDIAKNSSALSGAIERGVQIASVDVTEFMDKVGYAVIIVKKDTFQ